MTDAVGPDRNRLHDLVKLTWDEAQVDGADDRAVSAQDIADAGPYSVEQITEHLLEEQADSYVIRRDGDEVSVLALR